MKDKTEKYISKQKRKAEYEIMSRNQFIDNAIEMLAIDYVVAHHKNNQKKIIKNYQTINKFISELSPREFRDLFLRTYKDYMEIAKDCDIFEEETPQTLDAELSNLQPYFDDKLHPSMAYLGVSGEDMVLTKAKIQILRDYVSSTDAKYIISDIEKDYGKNKVPKFLIIEMQGYQPQA